MAAALDELGYLPGPPTRYNCGAADLLAGETFAYGVGASVAIMDVRTPLSYAHPSPSQETLPEL